MNQIRLKDIKPMIWISDNSVYVAAVLIVIATLVIMAAIYLILRWYKHKNRINKRREYFKMMQHIDFSNPKQAAYDITKYGYIFKDDSPRNSEMYENLVQRLQRYKYKKIVQEMDDETKGYFELYKGMIDV